MSRFFEPFTPEVFQQQTGMNALENEAVYLRWVNTQINYTNYKQMQDLNESMKQVLHLLQLQVEGATK